MAAAHAIGDLDGDSNLNVFTPACGMTGGGATARRNETLERLEAGPREPSDPLVRSSAHSLDSRIQVAKVLRRRPRFALEYATPSEPSSQ